MLACMCVHVGQSVGDYFQTWSMCICVCVYVGNMYNYVRMQHCAELLCFMDL